MPRPARRVFALFALALALFAALPCAALAESDSCCGAHAKCGEANGSPCAQLAATSCCEAPQLAVNTSFAVQLPLPEAVDVCPACITMIVCPGPQPLRRPAPQSLSGHVTIRDVLLRL